MPGACLDGRRVCDLAMNYLCFGITLSAPWRDGGEMEQNMSHACERLDAGSLIWMPAFMYEFQLRKTIPEAVGSLLHV